MKLSLPETRGAD